MGKRKKVELRKACHVRNEQRNWNLEDEKDLDDSDTCHEVAKRLSGKIAMRFTLLSSSI